MARPSGLGRASAEALAAEGCDLLIWSRGAERLAATAAELSATHGVRVAHLAADALQPGAAAAVSEAATAVGPVDILVLNAGGPPTVDPTATDPEGWQRAFQLLAATPIELATRLLPGMRERSWGRVVSILSSGVRQPIPDLVYSNAGRSALAAWLKTTAREVARDGVTVNGVMPGRIATPRIHELDTGRAEREGHERGSRSARAICARSPRPDTASPPSSAPLSPSSPRRGRRTSPGSSSPSTAG